MVRNLLLLWTFPYNPIKTAIKIHITPGLYANVCSIQVERALPERTLSAGNLDGVFVQKSSNYLPSDAVCKFFIVRWWTGRTALVGLAGAGDSPKARRRVPAAAWNNSLLNRTFCVRIRGVNIRMKFHFGHKTVAIQLGSAFYKKMLFNCQKELLSYRHKYVWPPKTKFKKGNLPVQPPEFRSVHGGIERAAKRGLLLLEKSVIEFCVEKIPEASFQ